jgi:hypothetical protein
MFTSAIAGSSVMFIFPAIIGFRFYFAKKTGFFRSLVSMCTGIFIAVVGVTCALYNKIKK